MKPAFSKNPYALSGLTVLLLCLSFPNPLFPRFFEPGPFIALFALVPMFAAVESLDPRKAFRLSFGAGFLFFLVSLVWINEVRPMGPGAPPAWIALAAYNALYVGLFFLLYRRGLDQGWPKPLWWAPALWTVLEFMRETFLDGFPWTSLGSSQYRGTGLLPVAAAAGIYGLHFVVCAANLALWHAIRDARQDRASARRWAKDLTLPVAVTLALLFAGKAFQPEPTGRVKVAVIQTNIDPDTRWDEAYVAQVMNAYEQYINQAVSVGAEVVVWPETNFPGIYNTMPPEAQWVRNYGEKAGITQLVGANEYDGLGGYWNSSFLVEAGTPRQVYRKRHLVMFGEYIPLRFIFNKLPFIGKVVQRHGPEDFLRGDKPIVFLSKKGHFAPIICWETVFARETREATALGAEVLVLQTFDGWFGRSAAPYYLTAHAALRAAESGRWVVRAATTGISGFADPQGNFHGIMGLDSRGFSMVEVERMEGRTLFHQFGNWFIWLCLVGLFAAVASARER